MLSAAWRLHPHTAQRLAMPLEQDPADCKDDKTPAHNVRQYSVLGIREDLQSRQLSSTSTRCLATAHERIQKVRVTRRLHAVC